MKRVKGFSYDTEKDKEIIDYICRQQNGSVYIWDLVRKDMQQGSLENLVKSIIEKYLQNYEVKSKESIITFDLNNDINELQHILSM